MQKEFTNLLDGKKIASEISERLKSEIRDWCAQGFTQPKLAVLSVGSDPASQIYIKAKMRKCAELGIVSEHYAFEEDVSFEKVADQIKALNKDPKTHGILLQLPLPKGFEAFKLIELIDPRKDVDGLCTINAGKLATKTPGGIVPCTPKGCIELIQRTGLQLRGAEVLVIGSSNLVGRPVSILLSQQGATVTVATSAVLNLKEKVQRADLIVSATGCAHLVKGEWIKKGAVVIDVGIIRQMDESGQSKLVGDVEFEQARLRASHITPVPGGVGPMTVAMLMDNVFNCCKSLDTETN